MNKGMLFGLSHREKRDEKLNLLHFPVFTSKNVVILKLPEPSTDSIYMHFISIMLVILILHIIFYLILRVFHEFML